MLAQGSDCVSRRHISVVIQTGILWPNHEMYLKTELQEKFACVNWLGGMGELSLGGRVMKHSSSSKRIFSAFKIFPLQWTFIAFKTQEKEVIPNAFKTGICSRAHSSTHTISNVRCFFPCNGHGHERRGTGHSHTFHLSWEPAETPFCVRRQGQWVNVAIWLLRVF